jgi:hypothetical protein
MARAILGMGAVAWSVGCIAAIVVAIVGVERLIDLLPPLQVDADAVRGAVIAVAVGLGLSALPTSPCWPACGRTDGGRGAPASSWRPC